MVLSDVISVIKFCLCLCRTETDKAMEKAKVETTQAQTDLSDLFDISRFDTNFMEDITCLLKPKPIKKVAHGGAAASTTTAK